MERNFIYCILLIQLAVNVSQGYVLNVTCKEDADCGGEALCSNGFCECEKEFTVFSSTTARCVQAIVLPFTSPCVSSEQCIFTMGVGSICSTTDLTCGCAEGYHYLRGKCYHDVGLGEHCVRNETCFVNYDPQSSECRNGKCECSSSYYEVGGLECRRNDTTEYADDCDPDLDEYCGYSDMLFDGMEYTESEYEYIEAATSDGNCENVTCEFNNTVCFLGSCTCKLGYFPDPVNKSLCNPEIGSTCSTDLECSAGVLNSECRSGQCVCQSGFVKSANNRACTNLKTKYNARCSPKYPEQCSLFGPMCKCLQTGTYTTCSCEEGYHYEESESLCWKSKKLGEQCVDDKDCGGVDGSSCISDVCQCDGDNGYSQTSDKAHCLKQVTDLGDSCYSLDDCKVLGSNVDCVNGACSCIANYYPNPEKKGNFCLAGINAKCTEAGSECALNNTVCVNGLCACAEDYTPDQAKSECLAVMHAEGDKCLESVQCVTLGTGSLCSDGICTCDDSQYHYHENKCWITKRFGQSCKAKSECILYHEDSSDDSKDEEDTHIECRNKICQCSFNYEVAEDGLSCVPSRSASIFIPGFIILTLWTLATKSL